MIKAHITRAMRAINLYHSIPSKAYKGIRLVKKMSKDMIETFDNEIFENWGRGERAEIADRALHMIFSDYMKGIAALDSSSGKLLAVAAYDEMGLNEAMEMLSLDYHRVRLEKLRERFRKGKISEKEYIKLQDDLKLPKNAGILMRSIMKNKGAIRLGYLSGIGRGGGSKLFGEVHSIAKAQDKPLFLASLDDSTDFYKKMHMAELLKSKVFYLLP